jgi:hypothetical protein
LNPSDEKCWLVAGLQTVLRSNLLPLVIRKFPKLEQTLTNLVTRINDERISVGDSVKFVGGKVGSVESMEGTHAKVRIKEEVSDISVDDLFLVAVPLPADIETELFGGNANGQQDALRVFEAMLGPLCNANPTLGCENPEVVVGYESTTTHTCAHSGTSRVSTTQEAIIAFTVQDLPAISGGHSLIEALQKHQSVFKFTLDPDEEKAAAAAANKKTVPETITREVTQLGKTVVLRPDRAFQGAKGKQCKSTRKVKFEASFTATELGEALGMAPAPPQGSGGYYLTSVIVHTGNSGSGHYVAYVKSGDEWYCFDDASASVVLWDDVRTRQASILVYEQPTPVNGLRGQKRGSESGESGQKMLRRRPAKAQKLTPEILSPHLTWTQAQQAGKIWTYKFRPLSPPTPQI